MKRVSRDTLVSLPNGLLGAQHRIYNQASLNSRGLEFYELRNPFRINILIKTPIASSS